MALCMSISCWYLFFLTCKKCMFINNIYYPLCKKCYTVDWMTLIIIYYVAINSYIQKCVMTLSLDEQRQKGNRRIPQTRPMPHSEHLMLNRPHLSTACMQWLLVRKHVHRHRHPSRQHARGTSSEHLAKSNSPHKTHSFYLHHTVPGCNDPYGYPQEST